MKHFDTGVSLNIKCQRDSIPENCVPTSASQIIGLPFPSGILLIMSVKESLEKSENEYALLSHGAS